jgi:hypothetical protein
MGFIADDKLGKLSACQLLLELRVSDNLISDFVSKIIDCKALSIVDISS